MSYMKKATNLGIICTLAAMLLAGAAIAQTGAAPKPQPSPATKPQGTPAAKPAASPTPTPQLSESSTLKTEKEKISYAIGMNIGGGLRDTLNRQSLEVDPNLLAQGFKDAVAANKTLMTEEEARATLAQLQNEMKAKMEEKQKLAAETNKKEGDAFLAANKAKEGVITLPDGLQYKILTPGTGPKPTAADTVVCNYRGTLINGKEFDSSYKRGTPATFPVTGVIKGWTEALQLMPEGSKWQLFVPADLAYGDQQRGPDIGPNSTLIFEVELISIQAKNQDKSQEKNPEKK
jgi:FKBP-type peptidyl-prolyl cis-trans isomerase FklB